MGDITANILDLLPVRLSHIARNKSIALATAFGVVVLLRLYHSHRRRGVRTPKLAGPPSQSILFGVTKQLLDAPDLGNLYAEWERRYGAVYEIPSSLGSKMLVLGDPTAIAHLFANDTTMYNQTSVAKIFFRRFLGDGLLTAEGETHKRQRRALSSGFSISAIRNVFPVFLDSAERLAEAWNALLESQSGGGTMITDVQRWMNYVSLDSVGKGAFSYDFQSLAGAESPVIKAFDSFGSLKPSLSVTIRFLIGPIFPSLIVNMPTKRSKAIQGLTESVHEIAEKLLTKDPGDVADKSILRALIRSETASSNVHMSLEEIEAQVQFLMIAGYETTAVTLTWALIELARNPAVQKALRTELEGLVTEGEQSTYDTIMNGLPFLDAFMCEILRLHSAVPELTRQVNEDDTIPLSKPITTRSGMLLESLPVAKGTTIRLPIIGMNRSEVFWGPDAAKFDPSRWLDEKVDEYSTRREEIHGYRHLLTFGHGPRVCLGRMFALTEMKAVLSILVRKFSFEFPGGPETELGSHRSIFLRPKVVGEEGPNVPLIVKKVLSG